MITWFVSVTACKQDLRALPTFLYSPITILSRRPSTYSSWTITDVDLCCEQHHKINTCSNEYSHNEFIIPYSILINLKYAPWLHISKTQECRMLTRLHLRFLEVKMFPLLWTSREMYLPSIHIGYLNVCGYRILGLSMVKGFSILACWYHLDFVEIHVMPFIQQKKKKNV